MDINAIKITKEDIEKLNEQGAIYTTKQNREEGNSANANTIWFGDNGEMFIDDQGRIIEKQEDGSEIYMGWTDLDKVTKQKNNRVDVPNNSNRDTKAVDTRLDDGRYVYKDDKSTPTQTKAQNTPSKPGIDVNTDPRFKNIEPIEQAKTENTSAKPGIDVNTDPRFQKQPENTQAKTENTSTKPGIDVNTDPRFKNIEPIEQAKIENTSAKPGIDVNTDPRFKKQPEKTQAKAENTSTKPGIDVNTDPRFQKQPEKTQSKTENTPTKPGIDVNTDPRFQNQKTTTQAKVDTSTKSKYAIDIENDPRFTNNAKITGINSTSGDFITQINQTKSEDTLSTPDAGTKSIFDFINEQPTTIPTPEPIKPIAAVGDTNDKYYAFTRDIMSEINTQRRQQGLPDLQWSDELTKAATIRAEELSQSKSHTRPNGQEWHTALDRDYDKNYGENLAWNYSSPDEFVNNWMNSASHRENLLSGKYNKVGISIYETEDGQTFCAAEFSS